MRTSILLASLVLATTPLAAQTTPAPAPAIAELPEPPLGSPRPFILPASERYTLANGMTVTLIPYGRVPKTMMRLEIGAGEIEEGASVELASLTATMLKEGTRSRDAAAIAAAAAGMGGSLATHGTNGGTAVRVSGLSDFAPQMAALIGDVVRHPSFPAAAFARIRADTVRAWTAAATSPGALASSALSHAMFGDHPYGRPMPTAAQLERYTVEDLRRFHAANFGARRARLYVAGRFDAATLKAAIERAFGDWQPGPAPLSLPPTLRPGPHIVLVDQPGALQTNVTIRTPMPPAGSPDTVPLRVAIELLAGSFSSRIVRNIREDKGYTYSPISAYQQRRGVTFWMFAVDVTTAVTGPALKEIFHEIRTLQTTPPPPAEAEGMRNWTVGQFMLENSQSSSLIDLMVERDIEGLPATSLDGFVPAAMAVTAPQMSAMVRRYMPLDRLSMTIAGDLAVIRPQLEALPELKGIPMQTVTVP